MKDRRGDFSPPTLYRFRFCLVDFFGAVFFLSFFMLCIRAIVAMMLAHTVRTIPIQSFTSIPFTPFHYLYYIILVRVCQAFFQTFLKKLASYIRKVLFLRHFERMVIILAKTIKGINVEIGGNTVGLTKALEDVNKQTGALQKELTAVDKALKLDPNNITLVKQKQDLLKESIEQTAEKLDTLKDVQKQVKAQFKSGDIGAEEYRAFQRELESTKQKLSQLEDEKKSVSVIGTAFKSAKDSVTDFTSKLEPVKKGLKTVEKGFEAVGKAGKAGFDVVSGAVKAAGNGLKIYTTAVVGAGTALAGLSVSSADSAKEIDYMSQRVGMSTKSYQEWEYIAQKAGTSMDTLQGGITDLAEKMDDAAAGEGEAAELFQRLGVSVVDANGNLRAQEDVFNDTIVALQGVSNAAERQAIATKLMSTTGEELLPLLNGEIGSVKELKQQANDLGVVMSDTAINAGVEFKDSLTDLQAAAKGAGNGIASSFLPALTTMSEDVAQTLPSISSAVAGLFSGKDTSEKLTNDLVKIINQLIDNFSQNLPNFISGFNNVLISLITAITQTLPSLITSILPTLIQGFTDLMVALAQALPTLIPTLIDGAMQLFTGLIDAMNQVVPILLEQLPTIITKIADTLIENLPIIIDGGFQLIIGLITGITESIPTLIDKVVALIPVITDSLTENIPKLITAGIQLIVALAKGFPKSIPAVVKAIPDIIIAIVDGFMQQDWLQIGKDILGGIVGGLWEGIKALPEAIGKIGGALVDGFKNFFGIKSPSKLFQDQVGKYLAEGIGVGFSDEMKTVSKQMENAVPTSFTTSLVTEQPAYAGISGYGYTNSLRQSDYGMYDMMKAVVDTNIQILQAIKNQNLIVNIGDRQVAKASNRGNKAMGYQVVNAR